MKKVDVAHRAELKKNSHHLKSILPSRKIMSQSHCQAYHPWDEMSLFFREADKHIK